NGVEEAETSDEFSIEDVAVEVEEESATVDVVLI
ncbi:hypothetical protein KIPB_003643, partial [Kipferlia bialata]